MGTQTVNKMIDEDKFSVMRQEVLSLWPTGKDVDLDEAVAYHKTLSESKNFSGTVERLCKEEELDNGTS